MQIVSVMLYDVSTQIVPVIFICFQVPLFGHFGRYMDVSHFLYRFVSIGKIVIKYIFSCFYHFDARQIFGEI